RGGGKGGRCQEFALAAALRIAERPRTLLGAFGTDGTDGPTDAAGAVVDGTTATRAAAAGLDARRALDQNDAYTFFSTLSDLIVTGPTNTNVNDIYLALVGSRG
ncbi:MAG: MOFRL family protein, partial [bacterium]